MPLATAQVIIFTACNKVETRYTPLDQVHPPQGPDTLSSQDQAGTSLPQAVHAGIYGQQVGSTHPTGMHSFVREF